MTFSPAGVLAGDGPPRPVDLDTIRQANIQAVKLRAAVNSVEEVSAYRGVGVHTFLVQLLSTQPGTAPTTAEDFVTEFAPAVEAFLKVGVTDFELHGEPNTARRGFGLSWGSPAAFSDWFQAVAGRLRDEFGAGLRIGFPALAPPGPVPAGVLPAVDDDSFLESCGNALDTADFCCCHVYWTSRAEMRDFNGALRFLRTYMERMKRTKPVVISEFANVNPAEGVEAKGKQYAEFIFLCQQYDRLAGAYALCLRSADPAYTNLTWIDANGVATPIPTQVAQRQRMPHPAHIRLAWPTVTRAYTQAFGDRQQVYYDASYDPTYGVHWLHGGHEGVDLRAADSTPIRACLGGLVSHGQPGTAYGNFVRVTTNIPSVGAVTLLYAHLEQITAADGVEVAAGEVLGRAGRTGNVTGPHLHLGFKIAGKSLRPTSHYLNAAPYLEPVRGSPRDQYNRTYVLLPPGADSSWAKAVVEATWDEHRFTVGGSADDAGIGDLDFRRVIAVNPALWGDDLAAFFAHYYPGVVYVPVEATTPVALWGELEQFHS